METLSSNGFSFDIQVADALEWLEVVSPPRYGKIVQQFPELKDIQFDGGWIDTNIMGVDTDFMAWVAEALEETGLVLWMEGEPFGEPEGKFQ